MAQPLIDVAVLGGVQHHLVGLKKTAEGALLLSLIERGLERYAHGDFIEPAFMQFLHTLLRKYMQAPHSDPATRFKVKLIQNQLRLGDVPRNERTQPLRAESPQTTLTRSAPAPAEATSSTIEATTSTKVIELSMTEPTPNENLASAPLRVEPTTVTTPENPAASVVALVANAVQPGIPPASSASISLSSAKLESNGKVHSIDSFERLLRDTANVFAQMSGGETGRDIDKLLLTGLEQLIEGHQQLGANLQRATNYLKLMQTDRDQLRRQLWRVRKSSLVDEATGLANRTALVRQLTAEMSRARRYGGTLALSLIAIDGFESFRLRHGEDATKQMLDVYGSKILRVFRTYDFAARYGTESFAVLFPHTDRDGAMRAIEKALMRVANTRITVGAEELALPTFSAVIAFPETKEKASSLLRRTDEMLTRIVAQAKPHTVVCLAPDGAQGAPPA